MNQVGLDAQVLQHALGLAVDQLVDPDDRSKIESIIAEAGQRYNCLVIESGLAIAIIQSALMMNGVDMSRN